MWNSKTKRKDLLDKKDFVIYKNYPPARILALEKRGRKYFLYLSWENLSQGNKIYEKWVRADQCKEYKPEGKKTLSQQIYGAVKLTWLQNLIVKLKNWWHGKN